MNKYRELMNRLEDTNLHIEVLKEKHLECNRLSEQIESDHELLDTTRLKKLAEELAEDIYQMGRTAITAMEEDMSAMMNNLRRLSSIKVDHLNKKLDADLKTVLKGRREISEAALDSCYTLTKAFYYASILGICNIIAKEKEFAGIDLEMLGIELAEWIKTLILDNIPFSGTTMKIVDFILEKVSGQNKGVDDFVWKSWVNPKKIEYCVNTLTKGKITAMVVIRFYQIHTGIILYLIEAFEAN